MQGSEKINSVFISSIKQEAPEHKQTVASGTIEKKEKEKKEKEKKRRKKRKKEDSKVLDVQVIFKIL